jgi:hypothetical protein
MTSSLPGNALWIVLLWAELLGAAAERRTMTLEQLRQQRQQIARRPRRVLFNNDGCDCLYFPRDQKATVDSFLARRTADLAGTHVDAKR